MSAILIDVIRNPRNNTTEYTLRVGANLVIPDELVAVDKAGVEAAIAARLVAEVEKKLASRRPEISRRIF